MGGRITKCQSLLIEVSVTSLEQIGGRQNHSGCSILDRLQTVYLGRLPTSQQAVAAVQRGEGSTILMARLVRASRVTDLPTVHGQLA